MPVHRIAVGDAADTYVYVSEQTGEAVMKTTRSDRTWGYLGAVLHWIYFTPFRRAGTLWAQSIIWLSIGGAVLCLSGLAWGIWRFSPSSRYRLKTVLSHSPYAGLMKWHHYAGLIFGLATFTWILSGLLSMDPWSWHPGNAPSRQQREAVAGGPLRLELLTLDRIREGVTAIGSAFAPKELEVVQFQGEPFFVAYRTPSPEQADQTIQQAADAVSRKPQHLTPGQRNQTARALLELIERQRSLPLRRAQLHLRHQPAQVAVPLGGFHEHRQAVERARGRVRPLSIERQLGADNRPHACTQRGTMEARCAVDAVSIEQRERGITVPRRLVDERFRERRRFEKAEGGGGVELDVHDVVIG
jgi:hypothetical protein